jgi:hypothetical protein
MLIIAFKIKAITKIKHWYNRLLLILNDKQEKFIIVRVGATTRGPL